MPELINTLIKPGDRIPCAAFNGGSYDCGRAYAAWTLSRYPGYARYLEMIFHDFHDFGALEINLFKRYAPHILELYRGMCDELKHHNFPVSRNQPEKPQDCTSFSIDSRYTGLPMPISGQTKDTSVKSLDLYIVLHMKLTDGPDILVLAYPGEVLGYGLWGNNCTVFRNDLKSERESENGLPYHHFGMLALGSGSVETAAQIALEYGLKGCGNILLTDSRKAVSIEFNCGGVAVINSENGLLVHANHPCISPTAEYEYYPDMIERENSRFRQHRLAELLREHSTPVTIKDIFQMLAHHENYPRGICRHKVGDREDVCTTATIIADPSHGQLYVTKGPACLGEIITYSLDDQLS